MAAPSHRQFSTQILKNSIPFFDHVDLINQQLWLIHAFEEFGQFLYKIRGVIIAHLVFEIVEASLQNMLKLDDS
jgi:hypothetical protein